MEHTLRYSLFLLFCILNFVCLSTQHGQVFVDQINPAKTDETYFTSITSDDATVGDLNVQTLSISHPEGLIAEIPGSLGFGGSDHTIVGKLGVTLGSSTTKTLELNSGGTITSLSQVFEMHSEDGYIRSHGNMIFQSNRGVNFRSDIFNLEGLFGTVINSEQENVEISSGVEVSSHSEKILIAADEDLFVQSQSGSVEIESSQEVVATADQVSLHGLLGSQIVADGNITVYAEDLFLGYSAESSISSFLTTTLSSSQNVDFTAADTILFQASDSASVSATSELYISAHGDHDSSVTLKSAQDISLSIDSTASFSAYTIYFDSVQQTLNSSSFSISSEERISVGSDGTQSIYINSALNPVQFSLSPGADNDLEVHSFFNNLTSTASTSVDSANDIKVVASNIKTQANDLSFSSNIFYAYSLTDNGRMVFDSSSGATFSGAVVNLSARDEVMIGNTLVQTVFTSSITAQFLLDLSVTGSSSVSLSAGRLTTNAMDTRFDSDDSLSLSGNGPLSVATTLGNIIMQGVSSAQYSSTSSVSFTSKRGDINVNSLDSAIFQGGNGTHQYNAADTLSFVAYGPNYQLNAGADLNFVLPSVTTVTDGLASFIVGLDFLFDATNLVASAPELLFSTGFDLSITSVGPVNLSSKNMLFKTINDEPTGGIFLQTSDTISFTANVGPITFDSANDLSLSSQTWDWITHDTFSITSSQSIHFGAEKNLVVETASFALQSDGAVSLAIGGNTNIYTTLDATYSAANEFDQTGTAGLFINSIKQAQFNGGELSFTANNDIYTLLTIPGSLNVTATNPGAYLDLYSRSGNVFFEQDTFTLTSDSFYSGSSDSFTSTTDYTQIRSHDLSIYTREYHLTTDDYTLTAASIDISTDEYKSSYSASSAQATFSAGQEVAFTSEGDFTWSVLSGNITVITPDLYLQSSNSQAFTAVGDINFFAFNDTNDIQVLAQGGTSLSAHDELTINSDNTMLWQAQRSLIFRSFKDGIFLFAEDGNFLVDSAASILYEASDSVDMIAYNPLGTASANFLSQHGILLQSDRNGMYFKSLGLTPNSTNGIYIESTASQGDVQFTSNDGSIFIQSPGPVTFTTHARMDLISAYVSNYTSLYDMDFTAANGGFNFNALTGVAIYAGSNGLPANLNFYQPLSFNSLARSQINIHSLGPIVGNAIEIKSSNGSIQFVTSDASSIYLTATNDQTFTGGQSYTIRSNEDISAVTPSGPIIFLATSNGQFITEGGPIQLTTQTGSPGGNINIDAITQNITFSSGNSVFFAAKQQYYLTAATDISISSADGDFAVAADSASSYITLNATGYIRIVSTGTRTAPEDGVYMEAANNVEIGTPTTSTITFNENNHFIIGDVSRPLVTINAGGSSSENGFTLTSDGAINATTENVFNVQVNGEFLYTGDSYLTSYSNGPSTIASTGTSGLGEDITLKSDQGTIRLEGDVTSFRAPTSITATAASNLDINQYGDTRNNKIRFNAPSASVTFEDLGNFLWFGNHVDADLTNSFSLTTSGDGLIDGRDGSKGTMLFRANNQFTIISGNLLNFENERSFGSISFEAFPPANNPTATPPISIQTATGSSISVNAYADLSITGETTSFLAGDRIIFEAEDAVPNANEPRGNIDFYASGAINVTSKSSVDFASQGDINIQTTDYSENVGAPISFVATDQLNINAVNDIVMQNSWNEGGSIEYQALSNINIQNGESNGKLISFNADGELSIVAARDYTLIANSLNGVVGGDVTMTATGTDPVDDYGIQFRTEGDNDSIDFRSLFGDVFFNADEALTITADVGLQSNTVSNLLIQSKLDGFFEANGDVTVDASADFAANSFLGSINVASLGPALFSTTQASSSINFRSYGVDDNGLYGIKFQSVADSAELIVTTEGPIIANALGALVLQGDFVSVSTFKSVDFKSNIGDILLESMYSSTFFSSNNIQVTASREIEFISAGTIYANSDGDIFFTSTSNEISLRTTGTDADLYMYSSGLFEFTSTTNFLARTPELPGADINITTTLGHIQITANSTTTGVTLQISSSYGPLSFLLSGDDTDFYVRNTPNVDIQADGNIAFTSNLAAAINDNGMVIGAGVISVSCNTLTFNAATLLMGSPNFNIYGSSSSTGIGGSISMISGSVFTLNAQGLSLQAKGTNGNDIIFASSSGDINFRDPVSITSTSIMKLPYNNYPGTQDYTNGQYRPGTCTPGEVFYISNVEINDKQNSDTSDGYFCFCRAANNLRCTEFHFYQGGVYYWFNQGGVGAGAPGLLWQNFGGIPPQ